MGGSLSASGSGKAASVPEKRRIGILGGTFDPIHEAHLEMARCARDTFGLDEVWIMPSGYSYFKAQGRSISEKRHREAMVKLAIRGEDRLVFSDRELNRTGATYTAVTLTELSREYPDVQWFFILGADSLRDLACWRLPETICRLAVLLSACRDTAVEREDLEQAAEELRQRFGADVRFMPFRDMPVSSSRIRESFLAGSLKPEDLPEGVYDYIERHHLYRQPEELTNEELLDACDATEYERECFFFLKETLMPERLRHSIGVMLTAVRLADVYRDVPVEKARLAGLLHDCGKPFADALGHGPAGAEIARNVLGAEDPEVLSAIRWHTTGHVPMTRLEMMIYVADYIEPFRRELPRKEECREQAFRQLDKAVGILAQETVAHLRRTGRRIDRNTVEVAETYGKQTDPEKGDTE